MRPAPVGPSVFEDIGLTPASTAGTTITADATPGNDGAWFELAAALARPADGIRIAVQTGGVNGDALVQLAVGAGGSEKLIVGGFPINRNSGSNVPVCFDLPLRLPKGVRVAARVYRSTVASFDADISIVGVLHGYHGTPGCRLFETFGVDAANARGTVIDPGASANTEGAVTSLGTLTRAARKIVLVPSFYGTTTWTTFNYWHWIRLYHRLPSGTWRKIGGPFFAMAHNAVDGLSAQGQPPIEVDLAKGTEIGATDQCQTGTAGRRALSLVALVGS